MLGSQLCVRTISGFGAIADQVNTSRSISSSLGSTSSYHSPFQLTVETKRSRRGRFFLVSCKSYNGSFSGRSSDDDERDHDDYLEASLLVSETIRHYHMRRHGYQEKVKWQPLLQLLPPSVQAREPRADVNSIEQGFLHRFQSPTIFLKLSCDGDYVLPIVVGEYAIEKLIDVSREDEKGDYPNQFQFLKNLLCKLGYEVKMVRITKRVINTYLARIYFGKPGERDNLSVDARPSDAINVAKRCKAPIYVNKKIFWADATRIVYGMGRLRDTKSIYDVTLDSAADGPDLLAEELDLVKNINLAVKEERYNDAAMWRDKLMMLIKSRPGH